VIVANILVYENKIIRGLKSAIELRNSICKYYFVFVLIARVFRRQFWWWLECQSVNLRSGIVAGLDSKNCGKRKLQTFWCQHPILKSMLRFTINKVFDDSLTIFDRPSWVSGLWFKSSLEQKLSVLGCSVFDADSKKVYVSNVWTILGMVTLPLGKAKEKVASFYQVVEMLCICAKFNV
jgi:hypothetical protein